MKIILASGNRHKQKEILQIIPEHTIILPKDMGIDFDHEETAETFYGNALGKAQALYNLVKLPVIADDSGICVSALGGAPGIYSARYCSDGKNNLTDSDRNVCLLKNMEGVIDRKAFFVCAMVLYCAPYQYYIVQETMEGELTLEPQGTEGFGYDPLLFIPQFGKTVAQLSAEEKNSISHRGKAGKTIATIINNIIPQN